MKRTVSLFIAFALCLVLCACGDVSQVERVYVDSEIFSQEDINSAEDVVIDEFKSGWNGCSLKKLYYAGDSWAKEFEYWKKRYNADEAIVLLSTFDVDSSGGDGSLNPNSTYEDFNWILVRSNGGKWEHKDHGY